MVFCVRYGQNYLHQLRVQRVDWTSSLILCLCGTRRFVYDMVFIKPRIGFCHEPVQYSPRLHIFMSKVSLLTLFYMHQYGSQAFSSFHVFWPHFVSIFLCVPLYVKACLQVSFKMGVVYWQAWDYSMPLCSIFKFNDCALSRASSGARKWI
jgi:hypothetical protein